MNKIFLNVKTHLFNLVFVEIIFEAFPTNYMAKILIMVQQILQGLKSIWSKLSKEKPANQVKVKGTVLLRGV